MPDFGPFSVDPAQIAALGGANFGQFVNRLIATETAAHGMIGTTLETTYLENVGDGGVDAGLRNAAATRWIPQGDSAWQFKAGDLTPAKCKAELTGATRAIETLRAGGTYRLVLGASRTSAMITARRDALVEAATELGVAVAKGMIEVIAADSLAGWIEQYPALAVSPLLRGTGVIGQTFDEWSRSNRHTTTWVTSPDRDAQIQSLRETISGGTQIDLHLDGVSGLGKTRLVLEALRAQPSEAIVVYSLAADSFPVTVLSQLQAQGRTAVVVIDECDRKQHEIYAQALTTGSSIRLVTLGEPGGSATRTPMISLTEFGSDSMHELLRANLPQLWPEAERVVVEVAAGNIKYALGLAEALLRNGTTSAGTLITDDDLRAFFTAQLPDGQLFLASCALALFSRFGHDGDVTQEIKTIADGLGLNENDLRGAASTLQRQGFLSKQGRYRAVGPHPLAVFLAARGWAEFGHKIVTDLLPNLEPDLAERLFRRAADIGELDTSSPAVAAILAASGPIASLETLTEGNRSALLVHFAVLAPAAVADRLSQLISAAPEDALLHLQGIRRDLVWALEKLAWHSKTFVVASDALLRLALAENESYSNNATGTWVEFFGTMLPGTAAPPAARMAYLQASAVSDDPRVRLIAGRGADRALEMHESIMVSGEVQGGVVVEPRGRPATFGEAWEYRNAAIDVLGDLTSDANLEVAETAREALVGSVHGLLEIEANRDHLGRVIASLSDSVVARTRVEVQSLRTLFDRAEVKEGRPSALASFEALLPAEAPTERLNVLGSTKSWDRQTDDLAAEIADVARRVRLDDPLAALDHLLHQGREIPAAYAVGRAIRILGTEFQPAVDLLGPLARDPNSEALIGYLHGLVNEGSLHVFDRFIDAASLPPLLALQFSVRGPRTPAAVARVEHLIGEVSVVEAARVLFGWMRDADQADSARYLREWGSRIESQADYNAAVDFAAMQVFQRPEILPDLDPAIAELVPRRREFPKLGQQEWDWAHLARRQLGAEPMVLAELLADLIEADALSAYSSSEESRLLQETVQGGGEPVWTSLMERLEQRQWRLSFSVRDWLGEAVSVDVAKRWVGDSVERARVLANVTTPGGQQLSATARFLIEEFGQDDRVPSHLVGQFISGMWSGNESERISSQISQVQAWIAEPGQSAEVKSWAHKLVAHLKARRGAVLQEEEERGW